MNWRLYKNDSNMKKKNKQTKRSLDFSHILYYKETSSPLFEALSITDDNSQHVRKIS